MLADGASAHPGLAVMEAFMYRFHPQWRRASALVADGAIGAVNAISTWFSYANRDPLDVRNIKEMGGGALMDIGCYGVSVARFITGREPHRVSATSDLDPQFGTDRLTSAVLASATQVGADTVITLDSADTITLKGIAVSNLHLEDFSFITA